MHRIKKTFLADGDFILPCVKSVLFSMLGAAFLGNGEIYLQLMISVLRIITTPLKLAK